MDWVYKQWFLKVFLGPFSNVNDRIMPMSDAVSSEGRRPRASNKDLRPCPLSTDGLIYQSKVERSTDLCAQINLRQSSRVIYETFVCRQSHRMKDRTWINVAAENNRHLNIMPLKTPRFRSLTPRVYDKEKHKVAKKEEVISWKRKWSYSKNTL